MKNKKGFTLIEVLVAMAIMGYLITIGFSMIIKLNVAIIRTEKILRQFDQSQLVCTQIENGNSGSYKCVSGKKLH